MKYMLLMYANESVELKTPEEQQAVAPEVWFALMKEMKDAGVLLSNNGLAPIATATTVRVQDGRTLTTDGPFIEAKEALGGYFVYQADNLDAAIEFAARIPAARMGGAIEVRPIVER